MLYKGTLDYHFITLSINIGDDLTNLPLYSREQLLKKDHETVNVNDDDEQVLLVQVMKASIGGYFGDTLLAAKVKD
jgi:hypothetical protein